MGWLFIDCPVIAIVLTIKALLYIAFFVGGSVISVAAALLQRLATTACPQVFSSSASMGCKWTRSGDPSVHAWTVSCCHDKVAMFVRAWTATCAMLGLSFSYVS